MPAQDINEIIDQGGVRAVYQPLIDLTTREVVGYEALARGPAGSDLENPHRLFAAAREAGVLGELDWACRAAAAEGALAAPIRPPLGLFVNAEPATLATRCPDHLRPTMDEAIRSLRVTVEVTERALASDPAGLLATVARIRELGWLVALDDVGSHPDSLALMPFLSPDVIKLDLGLIQARPGPEIAQVVTAVLAQAEATGATILAEGVENEDHLVTALGMTASLAQGWHFGRPDANFPTLEIPSRAISSVLAPRLARKETPFQLLSSGRGARLVPEEVMLAFSLHLERNARLLSDRPVVLSSFQEARHFTPDTKNRYVALAGHAAFVAAMGVGMTAEPGPGIRGADLAPGSPLRGEWTVVVVSPHFAGALAGRDLGDDRPDQHRRFEYAITHDRELVLAAARRLMAEVVPVLPAG